MAGFRSDQFVLELLELGFVEFARRVRVPIRVTVIVKFRVKMYDGGVVTRGGRSCAKIGLGLEHAIKIVKIVVVAPIHLLTEEILEDPEEA